MGDTPSVGTHPRCVRNESTDVSAQRFSVSLSFGHKKNLERFLLRGFKGAVTCAFPILQQRRRHGLRALCRREGVEPSRFSPLDSFGRTWGTSLRHTRYNQRSIAFQHLHQSNQQHPNRRDTPGVCPPESNIHFPAQRCSVSLPFEHKKSLERFLLRGSKVAVTCAFPISQQQRRHGLRALCKRGEAKLSRFGQLILFLFSLQSFLRDSGIKKEDTSADVSSSKGAVTYSPDFSVPSARRGLTSLFGMGRGGTLVLWPPYSLFLFPSGNSLPALCHKNHRLEANALLRLTNFRRDFFAVTV